MECNSYTQAGTERCQINLFKDPKTREPNSFTVKKGNNIFLFKIPFGKKQQVNADTIFGTQCKLFIHEPKNSKEIDVENEDKELTLESSTIYRRQSTKKHVGRTLLKQFHTEFFYYLIYDSGLAICSMVSFELIKFLQVTNFPDELYIGADYDTRTSTLTLFTKLRVVEFLPKRESEEIWKHFVKVEDYKWAYESAKKYDLTFLQLAADKYSLELLKKRELKEAAQIIVEAGIPAEDILLEFMSLCEGEEAEDLQPVIDYIQYSDLAELILSQCDPGSVAYFSLSALVLELRTSDLNELERKSNLEMKRKNGTTYKEIYSDTLEGPYFGSMERMQEEEQHEIVFSILHSHGRQQEILDYAELIGKLNLVVIYHLVNDNAETALQKIKLIEDKVVKFQIIEEYAGKLIAARPDMLLDILVQEIRSFKHLSILPSLLGTPDSYVATVIDYLKQVIKTKNPTRSFIYNLLVYFLIKEKSNPKALEEFLEEQEETFYQSGAVNLDASFIYRLLTRHNFKKESIYCLALMGNYEEAILNAVDIDCFALAKKMAFRAKTPEKRKIYLTTLIQEMIKKRVPTHSVLDIINEFEADRKFGKSNINIDSFLPYFDDNTEISLFKDQLARSLLENKQAIDEFKQSMQEYSKCVDQTYHDYFVFRAKKQIVNADAICEECFRSILSSEFIHFPCNHAYHKDCLIQIKCKNLNIRKSDYEWLIMEIMKTNLKGHEYALRNTRHRELTIQGQKTNAPVIEYPLTCKKEGFDLYGALCNALTHEEMRELDARKESLEKMLSGECPLCGMEIVNSVFRLFDADQADQATWEL